ncbi:MAG: hypothetical protein C4K58_03445 [Flavobacteriaceae bacterium]|nr:MAG: hypothetical protein C4K58_03445 [Flavobacteriaceae bacterium]
MYFNLPNFGVLQRFFAAKKLCLTLLFFIPFIGYGQESFASFQEFLEYGLPKNSIQKQSEIKLEELSQQQNIAKLGIVDATGNLLSASALANTEIPVSFLPSEIIGGAPGTFTPIETTQKYNANIGTYIDIKLLNLNGWRQYKLISKQIDLQKNRQEILLEETKENMATAYYNVLLVKQRLTEYQKSLETAKQIEGLVQNRYNAGLIRLQELNSAKINLLKIEQELQQINLLYAQQVNQLKNISNIENEVSLAFLEIPTENVDFTQPVIKGNTLYQQESMLENQLQNLELKANQSLFYPTVSFVFSNNFQLNDQRLDLLGGSWFPSSYFGLKASLPIPSYKILQQKSTLVHQQKISQEQNLQTQNSQSLRAEYLALEWKKSLTKIESLKKIVALEELSYQKNYNLYKEGLISLDELLLSFDKLQKASAEESMAILEHKLHSTQIRLFNLEY